MWANVSGVPHYASYRSLNIILFCYGKKKKNITPEELTAKLLKKSFDDDGNNHFSVTKYKEFPIWLNYCYN